MRKIAKILSIALIALNITTLIPTVSANNVQGEKRMFMVSGYYSPLPNQSFYVRGSYEADKRLNGNGTNGADGTQVYIGMLAAPKNYKFGTQVKIPGLGLGVVHDRGGAILAGRSYDRIDVWMGRGEEGLARALNWGMRLVEGEIYSKDQMQPYFDYSSVSSVLPDSVVNRLRAKSFINPEVFTKPITKTSSSQDISSLQEALRLFGYYHGAVDGNYDEETRQAVMVFQIDEGVILDINAQGAGNFGPKTQQALKTKTENFNSRVIKEQNRLKENIESISAGLGKKAEGDDVKSLQQMLWELGYYNGELNGVYNSDTMDAVLKFQKDNGIVQNEWEQGAGYFGKKTHAALVAAIDKRAQKIAKYPVEMQVWVPAKIDLPSLSQLDTGNAVKTVSLSFSLDVKPQGEIATVSAVQEFTRTLSLNDKGEDVKKLQEILISKGYLASGLNTGTFGYNTNEALIKFQIANNIIAKNTDQGAGVFGPQTQAAVKQS